MSNRKVVITNCYCCPFCKKQNFVERFGDYGELLTCIVQDNKELSFTDLGDMPELMSKVHESCKLDIND